MSHSTSARPTAGYDLSQLEAQVDRAARDDPDGRRSSAWPRPWRSSISPRSSPTNCSPNPRHLAGAEQATAELWRWHAVEEIEHKGVAYDTWLHATRDWPRWKRWKVKAKVMLLVTRNFVVDRTAGALDLMRRTASPALRAWPACCGTCGSGPACSARSPAPGSNSSCPASTRGTRTTAHLLRGYEASARKCVGARQEGSPSARLGREGLVLVLRDDGRHIQLQPHQPRRRFGATCAAEPRGDDPQGCRNRVSRVPGPTQDCRRSAIPPAGATPASAPCRQSAVAGLRGKASAPDGSGDPIAELDRPRGAPAEAAGTDQPRRPTAPLEDQERRQDRIARLGEIGFCVTDREGHGAVARLRTTDSSAIALRSAMASSGNPGLSNNLGVLANITLLLAGPPTRRPMTISGEGYEKGSYPSGAPLLPFWS